MTRKLLAGALAVALAVVVIVGISSSYSDRGGSHNNVAVAAFVGQGVTGRGAKDPEPSSLRAFAQLYDDLGFSVIPTKPASKVPDLSTWAPFQKRRATAEQRDAWFANGRATGGIGIVAGAVSGSLLIVDFDDRSAFEYCFIEWREMAQAHLLVESNRGVHVYVWLKGGARPPSTTLRQKPGAKANAPHLPVDLQGEGKFAVAPPSVHPSGKVYRFLGEGRKPLESTLDALENRLRRHAEEWPFVQAVLPCWREGNRNNLTLGLAKILRFEREFDEERVVDVVRRICSVTGDSEVQGRLRSVRDTISKGPERTAALTFLGEDLYRKLRELLPAKRRPGPRKTDEEEHVRFESYLETSDGRLVEEIETEVGAQFVVYDPKLDQFTVLPDLEVDGNRIKPLPPPRDPKQPSRKIVLFADGAEEYGTLPKLLDEMEHLAVEVFDPGRDLPVLQLWLRGAVASWVQGPVFGDSPERFAGIYPALGPSESGKGRLLTVARAFFYRPFYFLKTVRTPSLFRALDGWGDPTLILNEADLRESDEAHEFIEYLNSRADGSPITRFSSDDGVNKYFSSFGSTVLALRQPYNDDGFNSRTVPLHTETTTRDLDLIAPTEWWAKVALVQRKLLLFRLRTIARIRRGEVTLATRVPLNIRSHRVREVFIVLASIAKFEGPELLDKLLPVAQELEHRLVVNRSSSKDGLILNTVYSFVSDPDWEVIAEGGAHRLERTFKGDDKKDEREALTLRRVGKALGDAFSSTEVAKVWREFGQTVLDQARVGGRRARGVLLFTDVKRLDREYRRFVVDSEDQAGRFARQETL